MQLEGVNCTLFSFPISDRRWQIGGDPCVSIKSPHSPRRRQISDDSSPLTSVTLLDGSSPVTSVTLLEDSSPVTSVTQLQRNIPISAACECATVAPPLVRLMFAIPLASIKSNTATEVRALTSDMGTSRHSKSNK